MRNTTVGLALCAWLLGCASGPGATDAGTRRDSGAPLSVAIVGEWLHENTGLGRLNHRLVIRSDLTGVSTWSVLPFDCVTREVGRQPFQLRSFPSRPDQMEFGSMGFCIDTELCRDTTRRFTPCQSFEYPPFDDRTPRLVPVRISADGEFMVIGQPETGSREYWRVSLETDAGADAR